ncbi:MAG: hypothetical protein GQ574_07050 [Crocinitomix sp.]|nr:hypothetical protein [Crocinitomix sp.]
MKNRLTTDEVFNSHVRIMAYLSSKNSLFSDSDRLDILKLANHSASYPYEVQFKIAELFVKYSTELSPPNWQYADMPKKVELEWLKACFLNNENWKLDHENPFHIQILMDLLSESYIIPQLRISHFLESKSYVLQKQGLLFLKKGLKNGHYNSNWAKKCVQNLMRSENDSLILGALDIVQDNPFIFDDFPEKVFWILSKKSETVQIALIQRLRLHANNELFQRILEGESWSLEVKRATIKNLKYASNSAIIKPLITLLNSKDERLGPEIIETLLALNRGGFKLDKKQQNIVLEAYAKNDYFSSSKIAELITLIDEKKLYEFTQDKNVRLKRILNLLVSLNNKNAHTVLCKLYPNLKNNAERSTVLDTFLTLSTFESEDIVLAHFDELPGQSMRVLYYLGKDKTVQFLVKKLNLDNPTFEKINVSDWEEQALTFLLENDPKPIDLLNKIALWNPPYFKSISATLHPQIDGAFFDSLAPILAASSATSDLNRLMKQLITFQDKRGLSILNKLVLHSNEIVRDKAFKTIKELLGKLYENKSIEPRTLLMEDKADAVLKAQTVLLIDLLKQERNNFENQTIILQYLAKSADPHQVLQSVTAFLNLSNVHLEKIGLEIIGNTKLIELSAVLLPYLKLDGDIFRMRQAIIASEKIGKFALTQSIVELLQHRNMNIKKAAVAYLIVHGDYLAVSPLFSILKYNDNSGLRAAVKSALENILSDHYLSYALNTLEYAKTKREAELILKAIESTNYALINEIGRVHPNRGFKIEMPVDLDPEKKPGLKLNSTAITSCENALQELIFDASEKNKKGLRVKVLSLDENEFILLTDQLRSSSENHPKLAPILLDILRENGGVIDSQNLYLAASSDNNSVKNWAFPSFLQTENDFEKVQQLKLNENFAAKTMQYFIATDSSKTVNWALEIYGTRLVSQVFNSFKTWEFGQFNQLNSEFLSKHAVQATKWLATNPPIKTIALPYLFSVCKTEDKISFIDQLSDADILSIQASIQSFYDNLETKGRHDFIVTLSSKRNLFPFLNTTFVNDIIEGHLYITDAFLTENQKEELQTIYSKLLSGSRKELVEDQQKLQRLFNLLKECETLVGETVEKLIETDLFWEEDFSFVMETIKIKSIDYRWRLLSKYIKNGSIEFIQLLHKHTPIHSELLPLINDANPAAKLGILNWLVQIPEETLYFPQLFDTLTASRQNIELTPIVLRLMYKMCAYNQKFVPGTFDFIKTTLSHSDLQLQSAILNSLIAGSSKDILAIEGAKEFLLSKFELTELHTLAITCIIQSINWLNTSDKAFLFQHYKRQQHFDSEIISITITSIETLTAEQQIPVLIELSEIGPFNIEASRAIIHYFGADYQVLELLNEADKSNIIEFTKTQILSQNIGDEHELKAIIKSMGAYGVPDYDQLLERLLNEHKSSKIRSLALRELKKNVPKSSYLEICKSLLTHKDIGLLKQAISTLAHSKKAEITSALIPLLFHKNSRISKLAINGFNVLGELAIPYLKKEIAKVRPDKRNKIEALLSRLEH